MERKRCRQEVGERVADWAKIVSFVANVRLAGEDELSGERVVVDIGEMEVNVEKEPWGEWTHEEYGDGEFDPTLVRETRLEEVQDMGIPMCGSWRRGKNVCRTPEDRL